jgi:hypothetical protein
MAQIFISHSSKDEKQIDFLNRALASTNVQGKYEEIEALTAGSRNSAQVAVDIAGSNAVFVVLGPHVEQLKHTRDWVVWESGAARGTNKDVWVLEAFEDTPNLSVVIPHVRHYICFHYDDVWLSFLRAVITSYDDSHILKVVAVGAGGGAVIGESPMAALIGGGLAWVAAMNAMAQSRPAGIPITCSKCTSVYNVHVDPLFPFRCPICNQRHQFAPAISPQIRR